MDVIAEPQHLLGDRYRLEAKVGTGGMAEVYKAMDTVLDRHVAIKVLLPEYAGDQVFVDRFKREAKSAAKLSSPHIVSIYDWGVENDQCYIVMEYVQGSDLKKMVKRQGRLVPQRVAEVAMQVCDALIEAHAHGIIHRDIKSSNIMLQQSGNVKIMDFGIAQPNGQKKTGSVVGTVHYMSPEQIKGWPAAPASDLYSLGVVMYEMATGQLPFRGQNSAAIADKQICEAPIPPSKVSPAVDSSLERIILKAMEKNPKNRFASALELRRSLESYLSSQNRPAAQMAAKENSPSSFWALAFVEAPDAFQWSVVKITGPVVLGRGEGADISIPDPSISALHVRVTPEEERLLVEDLDSSNGTQVNGIEISRPAHCNPGDKLRFGNVVVAIGHP